MTSPQDPNEAPDWAFGPDSGITCPECNTTLSGLNWVMSDPVTALEFRQDEDPDLVVVGATMTGMKLIPCAHELPTSVWELTFSGRDRQMGTVLRTPKFQRKNGS